MHVELSHAGRKNEEVYGSLKIDTFGKERPFIPYMVPSKSVRQGRRFMPLDRLYFQCFQSLVVFHFFTGGQAQGSRRQASAGQARAAPTAGAAGLAAGLGRLGRIEGIA